MSENKFINVDVNAKSKDVKGSIFSIISNPIFVSFLIVIIAAAAIFGIVVVTRPAKLPQASTVEKTFGQKDNANVIIETYEDFLCPGCKAFNPVFDQVLDKYKDKSVKIVYNHFLIHGNPAKLAAEASEYAFDHGKFLEYKNVLFTQQGQKVFNIDNLVQFGKDLGLDEKDMRTQLEGAKYESRVDQDNQRGIDLGVNSTPTVFINGKKVDGKPFVDSNGGQQYSVPDIDDMTTAIDAALAFSASSI